jgi:hypothetical protein
MFYFFKLLTKMKMNQKFAKKAMTAASLTAGIIGFNSLFSEAQVTGAPKSPTVTTCKDHGKIYSFGASCDPGSGSCTANSCP